MDCRLTVYIFMIPIRLTLPLILILLASSPLCNSGFYFSLVFSLFTVHNKTKQLIRDRGAAC